MQQFVMVVDVIPEYKGSHGLRFISQFLGSIPQLVSKIRSPLLVSLNCTHAQDFQLELHFMNKVRNVKAMAIWTGDHVVFVWWELQMTFYLCFSLD